MFQIQAWKTNFSQFDLNAGLYIEVGLLEDLIIRQFLVAAVDIHEVDPHVTVRIVVLKTVIYSCY